MQRLIETVIALSESQLAFAWLYALSVIDLIIIHKVSHYRRLFSILIITRNPYRFSRPDRMTLTLTTTLILA